MKKWGCMGVRRLFLILPDPGCSQGEPGAQEDGPLDSHSRLGGASPLLGVPLPSPVSSEKGQHLIKIILVDHTAVGQRLQQVVGQGGFATIGHTVRKEKVLETTAR